MLVFDIRIYIYIYIYKTLVVVNRFIRPLVNELVYLTSVWVVRCNHLTFWFSFLRCFYVHVEVVSRGFEI